MRIGSECLRTVQQRAKIAVQECIGRNRSGTTAIAQRAERKIVLLVTLERTEIERLVFLDWMSHASPVIPEPRFRFVGTPPGARIQNLVMSVSKRSPVQSIGAGFQIEHHHASVGAGVPCFK